MPLLFWYSLVWPGKRLPLSSFISLVSSKLHRVISSPSLHQIGGYLTSTARSFISEVSFFQLTQNLEVMYMVFFFSVILKFPNMSISEKQKAGICYGTSICFLILPYKRCLPSLKCLIFFIQNFLGWTWLFFFPQGPVNLSTSKVARAQSMMLFDGAKQANGGTCIRIKTTNLAQFIQIRLGPTIPEPRKLHDQDA